MIKVLKKKAAYILTIVLAFFVFQFYLLLNSFQADYNIYQNVMATIASRGFLFRPLFWLSSELIGEVGLIMRFAGACFLLAFAWILLRKNELSLGKLRKGIFLEAVQYLFFIPFIIYMSTSPNSSISFIGAAISYSLQILIITPSFVMLYTKLRKQKLDNIEVRRWIAIGISCFVFALWVKHFLFNLYALHIDFNQPILILGLANSSLTLLIAAIGLLVSLLPLIQGKSTIVNYKGLGASLFFVGAYFVIYIAISSVNTTYLSYLTLTELWAIALPILGFSLIKTAKSHD